MLIATRCKKDISPACPETEVRDRMPGYGGMYVEEAVAPRLNALCEACKKWEPIHEKPGSRIFESCVVVDTTVCPHPEVSSTFLRSDADINRFDDLCRPCRYFHPGEVA